MMTSGDLRAGTMVGGRYRVERFVGQGGAGQVYQCKDMPSGGAPLALKVLASKSPGEEAVQALREEFSILSRVKHPCLVRIFDFGLLDESRTPYVVEEYVDGKDLFAATASIERPKVIELMVELCRVVQYLHMRGMLHADLKPSNVMVTQVQGTTAIKVLDFGLARWLSAEGRDPGIGTLGYAAPEVLMGKAADTRSDLYSIGVIFYQLLVRRLPFEDEDAGFLIQKQLQGHADMRVLDQQEKGSGLAQVVRSLLEKEPEKRPQSAEEVIRLLSVATGHDYTHIPVQWMESYFTAGRLVGRSREMSLLQDRAQLVKTSGRGWTVFLIGESGAGKSRCTEELRTWALLGGWQVVEGCCTKTEEHSYGPYRQILSKLECPPDGETPFRFEEAARVSEGPLFEHGETAAGHFRDQLTRELVRRLGNKPTLLLLHDFHWADEATTTVLEYLISDIGVHPVFVCVSARGSEVPGRRIGKLIGGTVRQSRGESLLLEGLALESVAELVEGLTGEKDLGRRIGPWVHKSSGGNPFFIEEILKHLVDRRLLRREQGKWKLEETAFKALEVPQSIAVVLRHRLRELSESAQDLAAWLAVFNRSVGENELQAAADRPTDESIGELASRQMVRVTGNVGSEKVEFCHALISEVIVEDLPARMRRRMHEKIACLLEERYGDGGPLQELAVHWMEANGGDKAVRYALKAAAECRSEYANDAALRFYEYILAHRSSLSVEESCEVVADAAEVCFALGIPKRAVKLLKREMDRVNAVTLPISVARLYLTLADAYNSVGDLASSEQAVLSGLSILDSRDVHLKPEYNVIKSQSIAHLAFCMSHKARPREGLKLVEAALNLVADTKESLSIGDLHLSRGALCWVAFDFKEGRKSSKIAIETLESLRAGHLLPIAYSHLGLNLLGLGRLGLAAVSQDRAVELSERTRSPFLRVQALTNSAECYCKSGHFDMARQRCKESLEAATSTGNKNLEYMANVTALEIQTTTGDFINARRSLDMLNAFKSKPLPAFTRAHALVESVCFNFQLGDWRRTLNNLRKLKKLRSPEGPIYQTAVTELIRARILHQRGKQDRALCILKQVHSSVVRARLAYESCLAKIALGEVLVCNGNSPSAQGYARAAVRLARAMPARQLEAEALILMSRTQQLTRRHTVEIISTLNKAIELAESSGLNELSWRAHVEMAILEEHEGHSDVALLHARAAHDLLKLIASNVPPGAAESFWRVPERARYKTESEQILHRLSGNESKNEVGSTGLQEEHLRTLMRVSSIINGIRELDPLLESVVDLLIKALGIERAMVFLKEPGGKLCLAKGRNVKLETLPRAEAISTSILQDAHRQGRPFVSANAREDIRSASKDSVIAHQIGALLCAPLKTCGRTIGVLYTDHPSPAANLSESLISLFAAFCNLVAVAVDNALAHKQLVQEKTELEQYLRHAREGYTEIVGKSAAIQSLRERIRQVASSPLDVLIHGESGTGKELVARAIHRTGRRSAGAFVPLDCGSLSDSLVESELFGYRKGAFTGAAENRPGLLEAANRGIIFLDEISNLSPRLQSKLLRVLQEREVRRIGETAQRKIDVQVIAATNKNIGEEIRRVRFRRDLYYRLNAIEIQVPPLRERPEDIRLLIEWFLSNTAQLEAGRAKGFSGEAMELLSRDCYPGNVRELKNIVQSSYYIAPGSTIGVEHLPADVRRRAQAEGSHEVESSGRDIYRRIRKGAGSFDELVKKPFLKRRFGSKVVRQVIEKALAETGGRYRDAFRLLKIPDKQYSVFMLFLKRNDCYLDFRPFRQRTSLEQSS